MTKKEMVKLLSLEFGLTQVKTKALVQGTLDAIVDALLVHGKIELRNFGVFKVKERKGRKARNPRTGESLDVEPKRVVVFRPGRVMVEEVNDSENPVSVPSTGDGVSHRDDDDFDDDFNEDDDFNNDVGVDGEARA